MKLNHPSDWSVYTPGTKAHAQQHAHHHHRFPEDKSDPQLQQYAREWNPMRDIHHRGKPVYREASSNLAKRFSW